jgi:hypothetical protein
MCLFGESARALHRFHVLPEVIGKQLKEIGMKSKALMAVAIAALFSSAAIAGPGGKAAGGSSASLTSPSAFGHPKADKFSPEASDYERPPVHTTADMITGGYKGWGTMANPVAPGDLDTAAARRNYDMHMAEVKSARDQVWVANAPLREPYSSRQALAAHLRGQQPATAVGASSSEPGIGSIEFQSQSSAGATTNLNELRPID